MNPPAAIYLLGHGLDAIVTKSPRVATAQDRLDRYERAQGYAPLSRLPLRVHLGAQYREAWRKGWFPRFNRYSHPPSKARRPCAPTTPNSTSSTTTRSGSQSVMQSLAALLRRLPAWIRTGQRASKSLVTSTTPPKQSATTE